MNQYDKGTLRVIGFASLVIVFSMLLIGFIVYAFTEAEIVAKLKGQDLPHLVQGISAKVDGRIERARETSNLLAEDPDIREWLLAGEPAGEQRTRALARLTALVSKFGYSNSFIVSAGTHQYWGENGRLLSVVSPREPGDSWFFHLLDSGKDLEVVLDYNKERKDTFVFVNVVAREGTRPLAVMGVGLNLHDLAAEFQAFKYGQTSRLWLVNAEGNVVMSDRLEDNGQPISSFVDAAALTQLPSQRGAGLQTLETTNAKGELTDLVAYPLVSTDMTLLVQVDRKETVSLLGRIKFNTIAVALISFLLILGLFYYVSHRLANPFERALQMNRELEEKVQERTQELALHNAKLMDSIDYARRIQESLLPQASEWSLATQEHVLIYKPRDSVGGDFHWVKPLPGGTLIAIGDCTGHGVPGALMTMLAISLLDRIVDKGSGEDPAHVLGELNRLIKQTLRQTEPDGLSDDGLDIGLCFIDNRRTELRFAGAKCALHVLETDGVIRSIDGERKSVGYRRTPHDFPYRSHTLPLKAGTACYMATDGFFDQSGGEKGYAFGKRRFAELLERYRHTPLPRQAELFWLELQRYMGDEEQRDDITLLAFQAS